MPRLGYRLVDSALGGCVKAAAVCTPGFSFCSAANPGGLVLAPSCLSFQSSAQAEIPLFQSNCTSCDPAVYVQLPDCPCMQALELFLKCCRQRAIQPLAAAAREELSQGKLTRLLSHLAETLQVRLFPCTKLASLDLL